MNLIQAVILGLVEGITEFLPISSTGHLVVATSLMGLDQGPEAEAAKAFDVVIQGGAILAVVGLYWPRFVQMLMGLLGRDPAGLRLLIHLAIAFVPAAALGLAIHPWIKANLFYPFPVTLALGLGGVYMLVLSARRKDAPPGRPLEEMTPLDALTIGVLQCVSLWPGTSRSMMTITGGMIVGLSATAAAEFSFLLGVPTLLAASGLDLAKDLYHAHRTGAPTLFQVLGPGPCVVGLLVAAISAAVAVRWLVGFLNRRGLAPFGWYRLIACVLLMTAAYSGVVRIHPPPRAPAAGAPIPTGEQPGILRDQRAP
jgi:undecaprenyl-diphosphatase